MSIARKIMMGAAGAGSKSTYVDDLFSTYLYSGNSTTLSVNNGVDNTKGGIIWFKPRTETERHMLFDTERGTTNYIQSNSNATQTSGGAALTSFDDDGYTLGASGYQNNSGRDYASWNFRKEKGFCDIVTWTGDGVQGRQIPHNLGSVPGCIIIKNYQSSDPWNWRVYHRSTGATKFLQLNSDNDVGNDFSGVMFNSTEPTASVFSVGTDETVNKNGDSYVAYIFAGGESTAATARSVAFDGSSDFLNVQSSSTDLEMGSSDFTLELWINSNGVTSSNRAFLSFGNPVQFQHNVTGNAIGIFFKDTGNNWFINNVTSPSIANGTWNHVAVTRSGNTWRLFLNGTQFYSATHNVTVAGLDGYYPSIGAYNSGGSNKFNGNISNLRFVKGTAVYTSSFKPTYEPLTNITNTKLLCCNNSSTTGSTVTPATIYAGGSPTASTDSPFDDSEGFKFGEEGDQNIIKCGSYITDSNEDADVNLGWEPQWVLVKRTDSSSGGPDWLIYDSFRGLMNAEAIRANQGGSKSLSPNLTSTESSNSRIGATSTGFYADQYGANRTYVYMAIRRPDPLVGKPAEAGTDVFTQAYGANSGDFRFTSNFPVDFAWAKLYAGTGDWWTSARLIQGREVQVNTTIAEQAGTNKQFDSNVAWHAPNAGDTYISHMWKRHAGFDVVTYKGDGATSQTLGHSLGRTPEMIWVKRRDSSGDWFVYNKGLDGGTNPETHYLTVNNDDEEADYNAIWNDTAPTSTHFTVGNYSQVNGNNNDFIAMLFASVDSISKVGYYDGQASDLTIEFGFQPRFLMVKRVDSPGDWNIYDTTRGLVSGADQELRLNNTSSQTGHEVGDITSTGFTFACGGSHDTCSAGQKYIYYAHA